jgi:BioD-like phosphotransacetylase family protein
VTSISPGAGKTMICAGLGRQLRRDGRKAGFFKPEIAAANQTGAGADNDAAFLKNVLDIPESAEVINPVFSKNSNLAQEIKRAYSQVARDKDVVLIEGTLAADSDAIIRTLEARTIIVDQYSAGLSLANYPKPEFNLLGLIMNKVAMRRLAGVTGIISSACNKTGIALLGVIPEDRVLAAITVAELAQSLGGEVLNAADRTSELVESVMIGAMALDSGPEYFCRFADRHPLSGY